MGVPEREADGDVARMLTMLLNHTREQGSSAVLYKRDRSNAHGTVDLVGMAHLLQEAGVDLPEARWCLCYVQWVQIYSVTAAGTTRAWRVRVGAFWGRPRGRGYTCTKKYNTWRPAYTGILSVWNDGVELAFDRERYLGDAIVPAATEETLVAMLSQQDAVAPKFKVRHIPSKEEYL